MQSTTNLSVVAAYHQVYLLDGDALPPYPEVVTDQHLAQGFQATDTLLAIYTGVDSKVSMRILVDEEDPTADQLNCERVIECETDFPSGKLIVAGCADALSSCDVIAVPRGLCNVLVMGSFLGSEGREHYEVRVWPSAGRQISQTGCGR